mmetsp:Transcript_4761/g.8149  ORF Transcript_4761/g.8149 Transcript_4761/m.8149 type:complete len:107 (+) Transcript_4761:604-924(+)
MANIDPIVASEAAVYIRIVSPGIVFMGWGLSYIMFCSMQGHPEISFYTTGLASIIHWFLAHYLAVTLDLRMYGVALATLVHFFNRYLFQSTFTHLHPKLKHGLIPL